jgi:4-oxalocrotonate tautomerase
MPFVTIQIGKGHSLDTKRKLVKEMTDTLVNVLGTNPEWVTVHIDEFERDCWGVGGQLHVDKYPGKHPEETVNS